MRNPLPGLPLLMLIAWAAGCSPQLSAAAAASTGASVVRIPFVVGLSTIRAVSTPEGDYETLRIVTLIDATGYRVVTSGEVPGDAGELLQVSVPRKVLAADQMGARRMRTYFHDGDADAFPGTVPGFSTSVVNELRNTGKAQFTFVDAGEVLGSSAIKGEYSGTLLRVMDPPTLPVLVNGRKTPLPVIHATGELTGSQGQSSFDYYMLDDPGNPIVLKSSGAGKSSAIVRIEYPEPKDSPTSLESSLTKNEVAQVYGIYFSFNRADIRPQSERVLQDIAAVLVAHPNWKLNIAGHTDNIGDDTANLDLSKRRAASVKAALVGRYRIDAARLSTGGYGKSSPQAENDTPEGRARNRRVELRRE